MEGFELWAYRGLIAILLFIGWYFFKKTLGQILEELKALNSTIKETSDKVIGHDGRLREVTTRVHEHQKVLEKHDDRIRKVERTQDQCKRRGGNRADAAAERDVVPDNE